MQGEAQQIDYFHHSSGGRKPKSRAVHVEGGVDGSETTSSEGEEEEEDKEVVREQVRRTGPGMQGHTGSP
jgi:hypothetical protein